MCACDASRMQPERRSFLSLPGITLASGPTPSRFKDEPRRTEARADRDESQAAKPQGKKKKKNQKETCFPAGSANFRNRQCLQFHIILTVNVVDNRSENMTLKAKIQY